MAKDTVSKITDKVIEDVEIRRIICSTNAIESLNAFAITFEGRINGNAPGQIHR